MATVAGLEQGGGIHSIPYHQGNLAIHPVPHQVCGVSQRQALPPPLHLLEEEPEQEGDGVLLLLHVGEVPPRAVELHRPGLHVHPRKAEADKANHHLLPILQR